MEIIKTLNGYIIRVHQTSNKTDHRNSYVVESHDPLKLGEAIAKATKEED